MAESVCPICKARSDARCFPFCSSRCRTIDLGHWLGERYSIPGEEDVDKPPELDPEHRPDPSTAAKKLD